MTSMDIVLPIAAFLSQLRCLPDQTPEHLSDWQMLALGDPPQRYSFRPAQLHLHDKAPVVRWYHGWPPKKNCRLQVECLQAAVAESMGVFSRLSPPPTSDATPLRVPVHGHE